MLGREQLINVLSVSLASYFSMILEGVSRPVISQFIKLIETVLFVEENVISRQNTLTKITSMSVINAIKDH